MPQKLRSFGAKPPRQRRQPKKNEGPSIHSRNWRRFRSTLFEERSLEAARNRCSLCVECAKAGKPYEAKTYDLHHIEPRDERPDLMFEPTNVEFLCKKHHRMKENNDGQAENAS